MVADARTHRPCVRRGTSGLAVSVILLARAASVGRNVPCRHRGSVSVAAQTTGTLPGSSRVRSA